MKKIVLVLMMLCLILAAAGCGGGGHDEPSPVTQEILSDPTVDADIAEDAATRSLTVTPVFDADGNPNVPSVFAGIDPVTLDEYRAFLDFPLNSIPLSGSIDFATLDIVIASIQPPVNSVPIRIELVSFPPPVIGTDFDRTSLPPLAAMVKTIFPADVGQHVVLDVTPLVAQAQARRQQNPSLQNFQIRIMEDLGPVTPGLIEIDESSEDTAPLLKVDYFP